MTLIFYLYKNYNLGELKKVSIRKYFLFIFIKRFNKISFQNYEIFIKIINL